MEMLTNIVVQLSVWMRPYTAHIGLAMVACTLVLIDGYVHGAMKQALRPYTFIIRVSGFIALFTFGYAMLAAFLTPMVIGFINDIPSIWFSPVVIVSFIIFGILLEMKK